MTHLVFAAPVTAALLIVPGLAFAIMAVALSEAPAEWAIAALLAWAALMAGTLAGAGLQSGAGPLAWLVLALAFVALMTGGPPGLVVVTVALVVLVLPASGLTGPFWLPLVLAVLAGGVALRGFLI